LSVEQMQHKILFIPHSYPPIGANNRFSGIFNRELVMAADLYDSVAVLVYNSRSQRLPTLHMKHVLDDGVPTWYATFGRSPIPKTSWLSSRFNFKRAINQVVDEWGKPDLIHTQDSYAFPAIKASRHLDVPYVMSQHYSSLTMKPIKKRLLKKYQWVFNQVEYVLPANKFAKTDYQHLGLNARVRWLPNALDPRIFYYGEAPREKWLLHASGFTPPKRFPDIVLAFAQIVVKNPQTILHLAGDGPAAPELRSLAKKQLPEGTYQFHGHLSKPELADLMRRCSGFVLPSEYETFGCVLMEAMACGLPVLTTRQGGIPAVVGEGQGLFVEVGDIEAIAQGMQKLLDGTHGIDAKRVSEDVRVRFSRETVGKILQEVYQVAIVGSHSE
jgi:L-malate glycosyltransferase